jgi:hypothetical protein
MPVLPYSQLEADKIVSYSGTTDAAGKYSVVYSKAYAAGSAPTVIPSMVGAPNTQTVRVTASNETGFTVLVEARTVTTVLSIQVLSSAATPVAGQIVNITLITND